MRILRIQNSIGDSADVSKLDTKSGDSVESVPDENSEDNVKVGIETIPVDNAPVVVEEAKPLEEVLSHATVVSD